jgi:hypothetical protein
LTDVLHFYRSGGRQTIRPTPSAVWIQDHDHVPAARTAALGSAAGGRANAAATETAAADARKRAQAAYAAATAELEALKPSRPQGELEALLAAARPVCRVVVQLGKRETLCAPPAALVAELGRAKRRSELREQIAGASAVLGVRPAKQAIARPGTPPFCSKRKDATCLSLGHGPRSHYSWGMIPRYHRRPMRPTRPR